MVRILACADLHGHAERVARVRALVLEQQPAVLLLPGDLTHLGRGEEALVLLHSLPLTVLTIPGNMDTPGVKSAMRRQGALLEGPPRAVAGVTFGGPDVDHPCDVLVVHEPPHGVLDRVASGRHIGSPAVREKVLRLRPRVVACGHVHESPGIERLGDTLVVNCTMGDGRSGGALIEITAAEVTARIL